MNMSNSSPGNQGIRAVPGVEAAKSLRDRLECAAGGTDIIAATKRPSSSSR